MRKIKTVFAIDRTSHRATEEVQEHWVVEGEGVATIKHDGTSCMIKQGRLYKRFDAKQGRQLPEGFEPCEVAPDSVSGHWPGWIPVRDDDPSSKFHREALLRAEHLPDGTYELVGPKVQGNRYGLTGHELWRHGAVVVEVERTREGLLRWLEQNHEEGLVFHHSDGRMAKVRRKDFGIPW